MAINVEIKAAKVIDNNIILTDIKGNEVPIHGVQKIKFNGRFFEKHQLKISGKGVVIGAVRIPLG